MRPAPSAAALRRLLGERARFLRSFLRSPRQVGSVLPTSRSAVRDMLDMAPPAKKLNKAIERDRGRGPSWRSRRRRSRSISGTA
jgi:phospholipid N-methyltransferase